jgi:hypothetical protein
MGTLPGWTDEKVRLYRLMHSAKAKSYSITITRIRLLKPRAARATCELATYFRLSLQVGSNKSAIKRCRSYIGTEAFYILDSLLRQSAMLAGILL